MTWQINVSYQFREAMVQVQHDSTSRSTQRFPVMHVYQGSKKIDQVCHEYHCNTLHHTLQHTLQHTLYHTLQRTLQRTLQHILQHTLQQILHTYCNTHHNIYVNTRCNTFCNTRGCAGFPVMYLMSLGEHTVRKRKIQQDACLSRTPSCVAVCVAACVVV